MIIDPFTLTDPLTQLPNRRALQSRLADEYGRARALRLPLSLLAIDLDHFKEVNRRFLLPGGDKILAEVARLVSSSARPGDMVARDGGDQFSFILPETDSEEACREAERIRLAIAEKAIDVRGQSVTVTTSIGVATATFTETEPWELFVRARNAVHHAKDLGRSRVEVAHAARKS